MDTYLPTSKYLCSFTFFILFSIHDLSPNSISLFITVHTSVYVSRYTRGDQIAIKKINEKVIKRDWPASA